MLAHGSLEGTYLNLYDQLLLINYSLVVVLNRSYTKFMDQAGLWQRPKNLKLEDIIFTFYCW